MNPTIRGSGGREGALGGGPVGTSLLHASVSSSINGEGVMDKMIPEPLVLDCLHVMT